MKIAVSSYSFGDYKNPDKLGLIGTMDEAKRMGFEAFELDDNEETNSREVLFSLRKHSEKIDLPIIAFDVGADFTKNDLKSYREEIERVKKLVDNAVYLGVPMMRHDVSYGNFSEGSGITFDRALEVMVYCCREVAEYAEKAGIRTMFENHGFYIQEHSRVERLLNEVCHPNFGLLLDIGNFMCADDDPVDAVTALASKVVHVHAKDFHFNSEANGKSEGRGWFKTSGNNYLQGAVIGCGDARVEDTVRILKNSGYDGYITIEYEGVEDNLVGISRGLENLRKFI